MNTLNLIKNYKSKRPLATLHDAQIAMTTYRGVKYECQLRVKSLRVHGTFCYRGHTYNK